MSLHNVPDNSNGMAHLKAFYDIKTEHCFFGSDDYTGRADDVTQTDSSPFSAISVPGFR